MNFDLNRKTFLFYSSTYDLERNTRDKIDKQKKGFKINWDLIEER